MDSTDLLRLQAAALFRHDSSGRITGTNETPPDPVPRLFLAMSTSGTVGRLHADLPVQVASRLTDVLVQARPPSDISTPPPVSVELLTLLASHAPITSVIAGPSWHVPGDAPPPVAARLLTMDDTPSLRPEFSYTADNLASLSPVAAVIENGQAVAVCSSVRITADACEAGLHTLAAARGRGLGPDAVLAWAAAVRASGRLPLYSTSWDNRASCRVAEKLGLVQYGITLSIY